jgi:hypothetical protein
MIKLKLALMFLSTISIVGLIDSNAYAFNLILGGGEGGTQQFFPASPYTVTNPYTKDVYTGITRLRRIEKINMGGSSNFRSLLNAGWPNLFNFRISRTPLPGSVEVTQYIACGANQLCPGNTIVPSATNGVGARIEANYIPPSGSSIPPNIAWIQRVTTNHSILPGGGTSLDSGHGIPYDNIDVASAAGVTRGLERYT